MVKILVKKFDKNISLPSYKTSGASGMDLVAFIKHKITINMGIKIKLILFLISWVINLLYQNQLKNFFL